MNLYLFDVDHTLLDIDHLHEEAFIRMYEEVFNVKSSLCLPKGEERTTYNIIRCALTGKVPGIQIERQMKDAIQNMVNLYFSRVNPLFVHSNVESVIKGLDERGIVAVFTGGAGAVTEAVLKKAGLHSKFRHISTNDDAETRRDIVAHAIEKASLGRKFDRIFVIGDTPEDVDAAKANNAVAVCVAMGHYTREQLEKAGADIVFDNWEDREFILEKLK